MKINIKHYNLCIFALSHYMFIYLFFWSKPCALNIQHWLQLSQQNSPIKRLWTDSIRICMESMTKFCIHKVQSVCDNHHCWTNILFTACYIEQHQNSNRIFYTFTCSYTASYLCNKHFVFISAEQNINNLLELRDTKWQAGTNMINI